MRAGPVSPLPSVDDSEQLVLRGRSARELVVTPNTRESDVAVYLDAWKRKVERVGTLNFPLEARRQGLSGSPVLWVAVCADGGMSELIGRSSSGHTELDQAALAILKLATPFDPFRRSCGSATTLRFASRVAVPGRRARAVDRPRQSGTVTRTLKPALTPEEAVGSREVLKPSKTGTPSEPRTDLLAFSKGPPEPGAPMTATCHAPAISDVMRDAAEPRGGDRILGAWRRPSS
jgi:protein TonB